jgi:hypothetical protein
MLQSDPIEQDFVIDDVEQPASSVLAAGAPTRERSLLIHVAENGKV